MLNLSCYVSLAMSLVLHVYLLCYVSHAKPFMPSLLCLISQSMSLILSVSCKIFHEVSVKWLMLNLSFKISHAKPLSTVASRVQSLDLCSVSGAKYHTGLRWNFFFKVRVVSYVFRYADFGKNTQKIPACTVFTQIENFCMERVKPGCFIDK